MSTAFEHVKLPPSQGIPHTGTGMAALLNQNPNDVVVTLAIRSPLCKARKGGFKDTRSDELITEMIKQTLSRIGFDPSLFGDVCVGTVLDPMAPYAARAAALVAGIPETVPVQTINRFCSSGLMAVTTIANQISTHQIDVGLAIGVESMSQFSDERPTFSEEIQKHGTARDCGMPMGWTSENVAKDFNVTRVQQDEYAAMSFQRAERAQKEGWFQSEIVPFKAFAKQQDGSRKEVVITQDEGIRAGTTAQSLGKIRSAFPQWGNGTTTGGNASQVTDGAAAVVLMRRSKARELGVKILAKYVTTAVAGVAPRIMGVGPVAAILKVLSQAGISKEDVDLFEINEAFASMYVYCVRELGLDVQKVNVNGGAIALGHPLGCTGARQIATGLNELRRRNKNVLVTSMCIGTGQGAAAIFVRED